MSDMFIFYCFLKCDSTRFSSAFPYFLDFIFFLLVRTMRVCVCVCAAYGMNMKLDGGGVLLAHVKGFDNAFLSG